MLGEREREDKEALLPFERQIEVMGLNQGILVLQCIRYYWSTEYRYLCIWQVLMASVGQMKVTVVRYAVTPTPSTPAALSVGGDQQLMNKGHIQ